MSDLHVTEGERPTNEVSVIPWNERWLVPNCPFCEGTHTFWNAPELGEYSSPCPQRRPKYLCLVGSELVDLVSAMFAVGQEMRCEHCQAILWNLRQSGIGVYRPSWNPIGPDEGRCAHLCAGCADGIGGYWASYARIRKYRSDAPGDDTVEGWVSHLRGKTWWDMVVEVEFENRASYALVWASMLRQIQREPHTWRVTR